MAGIEAVDPHRAVTNALSDLSVDRDGHERCVVIAIGKAAPAMASAAVEWCGDLPVSGVVVSSVPTSAAGLDVLVASHPIPDATSESAGRRVLDTASTCGAGDLVLVLISGGGSSLCTVPAPGLTLYDLVQTTSVLLRSGATINEVNTVRKHLSGVKGGRLAEAIGPDATLLTLILSDVVGNPLDVIASGPTVPDPSTLADARSIVADVAVPPAVRRHLAKDTSETPKGGDVFDRQTVMVVGDGTMAAHAAAASLDGATVVSTTLEGEAREIALQVIDHAKALKPGESHVYAGETTVTVTGNGRGGRNQELALAAAIALDGRDDLTLLSIGTDGIDGMSDAAGAFADGATVATAAKNGMDAQAALTNNDSHAFHDAAGSLVVTGPTGTNVGDLILVHRR